jgi:CRISPR/Cas system CSM-associated protein Csm5 (group 7 of RAMP superfamily)
MKTIFLSVEVQLENVLDHDHEFADFGAVNLSCEGREYSMDIAQSYWYLENGQERIELKLTEDREELNDCNYQLTDADFHNPNLIADVYIGGEFGSGIEHATLFIKQGDMTKAIDLAF